MRSSEFGKSSDRASIISEKKLPKSFLVASAHKASSQPSFRRIASIRPGKSVNGAVFGNAALFLLKLAALETVRRFSKAKCPFAWRGLQALQVLCFPPFKWIQRFAPFKGLVKGMQMISRPLLVLSITTAISEASESNDRSSGGADQTNVCSEVPPEISSVQTTLETRAAHNECPQNEASEIWLIQLQKELERQGISLPERINEYELRRFYTAANEDFPCFLASIKKTIRWRETYRILSPEELHVWSSMVFWHGFDVKQRPCLVVRLGLACVSLQPPERPRFAQAIISHVEHGVLHLVDPENSEITVLVDCEGLSPFKIPMQVLRTCSTLLQDHFPNRLGCLFVIRLPPVLRVIAQTFIQMLKPVTRKKLKIEGEMYRKVLSEYLQTVPSCLGGECTCEICSEMDNIWQSRPRNETMRGSTESVYEGDNPPSESSTYETAVGMNGNCDQVLRTAMISILIFWIFLALVAGLHDPESRPFFTST